MNPRNQAYHQQPKEFEEKVIEIKRLSKKTKGGNQISFSALVVIGDRKGRGGIGHDKAKDVLSAIQKSIRLAKRNLVTIDLADGTIPHEVLYKRGAATILLKPAPEGTGVIAGGSVRAVVEVFGIRNIVSKRLGTSNKMSNVYATLEALQQIKKVSKRADKRIELKEEKKVEDKKTEKKPAVKKNAPKKESKPKKGATKKTTVKEETKIKKK